MQTLQIMLHSTFPDLHTLKKRNASNWFYFVIEGWLPLLLSQYVYAYDSQLCTCPNASAPTLDKSTFPQGTLEL